VAYSFRSSSALVQTFGASITVAAPAGIVAGDLLVFSLVQKAKDWGTFPAGWVLAIHGVAEAGSRTEIWYKRATGSEPANYTVTLIDGFFDSLATQGIIVAYAGGLAAGVMHDQVAFRDNPAGTSGAPSISPTTINQLVVTVEGKSTAAPFPGSSPSLGVPFSAAWFPMTSRANQGSSTPSPIGIGVAERLTFATASPTGDVTGYDTTFGSAAAIASFFPAVTEPGPGGPTRYYPVTSFPSVRVGGPWVGVWGDKATADPNGDSGALRLQTSKVDGGWLRPSANRCNRQGNYDFAWARFATPPLVAQLIDGTFDVCFQVRAAWEDAVLADTTASVVVYKVHVYIAIGESTTVRHTLLDNYVDSGAWVGPPVTATYQGLAGPPTLLPNSTVDGDVIVIEIGARIVSSPTPAPTYPASNMTALPINGIGVTDTVNAAYVDAAPGDTFATFAPWMEFSGTHVPAAVPLPPANGSCATATVIASLPYDSGFIDTTQATDPGWNPGGSPKDGGRAVWWTWTADRNGTVFFATRGSNYPCSTYILQGGCGGLSFGSASWNTRRRYGTGRDQGSASMDVVAGVTYHIVVQHWQSDFFTYGNNQGGSCRLLGFYREVPVENDIYIVSGDVLALRETSPGVLTPVNLGSENVPSEPAGVAIDYTKRPMVSVEGVSPHVDERLLVASFAFGHVDVMDLKTLAWSDGFTGYVDYLSPWGALGPNAAQMYITAAGFLWFGQFGNGFHLVGSAGLLPAFLDNVSDDPDISTPLGVEAINGTSQAGSPFAYQTLNAPHPVVEHTAVWCFTVDEANNILFYSSGGQYSSETGDHPTRNNIAAVQIKRYDLSTNTQLADFATVTPAAGVNPGLKGMRFLPGDGGLLVCNGSQVLRLSSAGAVVGTFTPSIPAESNTLQDLVVLADQSAFWVQDLNTTRLFKFDLAVGIEVATYQPYAEQGGFVQMAIYLPDGHSICPPGSAPCPPPPCLDPPCGPPPPPGPGPSEGCPPVSHVPTASSTGGGCAPVPNQGE